MFNICESKNPVLPDRPAGDNVSLRNPKTFISDAASIAAPVDQDALLTTEQVATLLAMKPATLEKGRSTGLVEHPPFIRIGRLVRYRRSAVTIWLQERECQSRGVL